MDKWFQFWTLPFIDDKQSYTCDITQVDKYRKEEAWMGGTTEMPECQKGGGEKVSGKRDGNTSVAETFRRAGLEMPFGLTRSQGILDARGVSWVVSLSVIERRVVGESLKSPPETQAALSLELLGQNHKRELQNNSSVPCISTQRLYNDGEAPGLWVGTLGIGLGTHFFLHSFLALTELMEIFKDQWVWWVEEQRACV